MIVAIPPNTHSNGAYEDSPLSIRTSFSGYTFIPKDDVRSVSGVGRLSRRVLPAAAAVMPPLPN